MKELREILDRIDRFAPHERAILATVVDVKGSGYRLAGARMLIDEQGNAVGTRFRRLSRIGCSYTS